MPPLELSPEDRAGMSPAEIEALTATGADELLKHVGDAPKADEVEAKVEDKPAAEKAAEKPAESTETAEAETATEAEVEQPEVEAKAEPAPKPAPFRVEGPADWKAERKVLRDEKAAVEAEWGEGKIDDATRAAKLEAIDDKIDDLLVSATRAQTLQEVNTQTAEKSMNEAVAAVLAQTAKDKTIDYNADPKAAKEFDQFLNMLAADPENRGKSAVELTQAAHKSVLALRGISAAPAAAPAPAPAAPKGPREAPRTLSGLPAAAGNDVSNDMLESFKNLQGEEAEDFLAALPESQQKALLRAADAVAFQR